MLPGDTRFSSIGTRIGRSDGGSKSKAMAFACGKRRMNDIGTTVRGARRDDTTILKGGGSGAASAIMAKVSGFVGVIVKIMVTIIVLLVVVIMLTGCQGRVEHHEEGGKGEEGTGDNGIGEGGGHHEWRGEGLQGGTRGGIFSRFFCRGGP